MRFRKCAQVLFLVLVCFTFCSAHRVLPDHSDVEQQPDHARRPQQAEKIGFTGGGRGGYGWDQPGFGLPVPNPGYGQPWDSPPIGGGIYRPPPPVPCPIGCRPPLGYGKIDQTAYNLLTDILRQMDQSQAQSTQMSRNGPSFDSTRDIHEVPQNDSMPRNKEILANEAHNEIKSDHNDEQHYNAHKMPGSSHSKEAEKIGEPRVNEIVKQNVTSEPKKLMQDGEAMTVGQHHESDYEEETSD